MNVVQVLAIDPTETVNVYKQIYTEIKSPFV
jgi:hypothetical protein